MIRVQQHRRDKLQHISELVLKGSAHAARHGAHLGLELWFEKFVDNVLENAGFGSDADTNVWAGREEVKEGQRRG